MTARKWSAWVVETLKTAVAVIAKRAAIAPLILCGGLMAAPSALAVGLGEISVNSSLNEPLNASIALLSSEDLQDGQILVSLASPEAFERVGLSRDFLLTQLKFAVERDGANVRVIKVSSEQAITEPYLNFLVQLQWPAGRVQREYTVLLDLPIYSAQNSTAQIAPAQTAAVSNTRIQSNKSAQGKQGESDSFSQTRRLRSQPPLSGDQHRVVVGDTLWNVAERLRPQDATIQQAMDALYRHNADAFVQGDANQIKEGSVLRLPTDSEIQQESGTRVVAQLGWFQRPS
jgi:FimV N-terminal domain